MYTEATSSHTTPPTPTNSPVSEWNGREVNYISREEFEAGELHFGGHGACTMFFRYAVGFALMTLGGATMIICPAAGAAVASIGLGIAVDAALPK